MGSVSALLLLRFARNRLCYTLGRKNCCMHNSFMMVADSLTAKIRSLVRVLPYISGGVGGGTKLPKPFTVQPITHYGIEHG